MPIIKDGTYVINLDYKNNKGTHWVSLFTDTNLSVYFDSFGTEYIPQEVSNKIKDKPITPNIIRIQDNESIIYYVCILLYRFYRIYICLQEKLYTNLLSPDDYKKNDKIIYKYFKDKYERESKY